MERVADAVDAVGAADGAEYKVDFSVDAFAGPGVAVGVGVLSKGGDACPGGSIKGVFVPHALSMNIEVIRMKMFRTDVDGRMA